MSTASAPAPDGGKDSKGKVGTADALKALDEIAKWRGRWETVHWVYGLLPIIAAALNAVLVKLFETGSSYLEVLGNTAPLMIGVTLLVVIYSHAKMNWLGYALTTLVVLSAGSYVSRHFGIGAPVDWATRTGSFDSSGNFHPVGWPEMLFGDLFNLISAYFHAYRPGPFFVSVMTGIGAGAWLSGKVKE